MKGVIRKYPGGDVVVVYELRKGTSTDFADVVKCPEGLQNEYEFLRIKNNSGKLLTPLDGAEFIQALPEHFTGAYTRAEVRD